MSLSIIEHELDRKLKDPELKELAKALIESTPSEMKEKISEFMQKREA
jgi:hypothetical protein